MTETESNAARVRSAHTDARRVSSTWLLGALVPLASPGVALAQETAPAPEEHQATEHQATVEEIVVTARRFEESLQSTPVAVSAFTGAGLEQAGAFSLVDAAAAVPNLTMSSTGSGAGGTSNTQAFLRGVGQTDFLITTDPGVAIYIDGVYYARTTGSAFDVIDLERIEVLRGPQGTLFGKNAVGGAISLISRPPSDRTGGSLQLTTGSFNRADIRASVDLPLSDTVRTRISGVWRNRDGFARRTVDGGDLSDQNQLGGRFYLDWAPSDRVSFSFIADGTRERGGSAQSALMSFNPNVGLARLWRNLVQIPQGLSLPIVNAATPFVSSATGPNVSNLDLWGTSLTGKFEVSDNIEIKSITAYRKLKAEFARDGDNSPSSYVETHNRVNQDQFSQELQLIGGGPDSKFRWVVGGYYFNEGAIDRNDVRLASGLYRALEALPGPVVPLSPAPCPVACAGGPGNPINIGFDLDFDIYNRIRTRSYAAFGQASYAITDALRASVGLRYTKEDKSYFLDHRRVNSGAPIIVPTLVKRSDDDISPRFGLDYRASEAVFLYASAAKGFKSGGFNGRPTTIGAVQSFGPETLWSYEIGAKTDLLNRRLRFNIAGFFSEYKDIQLSSVRADSTGNLILVTENAGRAETKGVEIELTAIPTTGLNFTASLGYLDARYTSLNPGATITLATSFVKAPEWTAGAALSYTFELSPGAGDLMLRGDWTYRSHYFNEPTNSTIIDQDGFSLFNARIAWTSPAERFEVALFGTNLTDKRYIASGLSSATSFGLEEANFGRPREWGASLKYSF